MRSRSPGSALRFIASAAVALAACATPEPTASPGPSNETLQPTWVEIACPENVEVALLVDHACGRLSVLEDRSKPAGRTISLFVVRMDPPEDRGQPIRCSPALDEAKPRDLEYATYRLDDGVTFVHVAQLPDGDNPLGDLPAFAEFQREILDRCVEQPAPARATVVGSYRSGT